MLFRKGILLHEVSYDQHDQLRCSMDLRKLHRVLRDWRHLDGMLYATLHRELLAAHRGDCGPTRVRLVPILRGHGVRDQPLGP